MSSTSLPCIFPDTGKVYLSWLYGISEKDWNSTKKGIGLEPQKVIGVHSVAAVLFQGAMYKIVLTLAWTDYTLINSEE